MNFNVHYSYLEFITMVFGYAPLGSCGTSHCNKTPFPLFEGEVWARDYITTA